MALAPSFAGVILAAGASSRMGRDKALLPWQGGTFLSTAIRALQPVTDLVIVVAGANVHELTPVVDANAGFLVVNPSPERGQFSSLRIGLQEVLNRGRDAAVITLVDRPAAAITTVRRIQEAFLSADDPVWAMVPEYGGKHGHPIVIGREMITAFLNAPESSTAREVEHSLKGHVQYLPIDDPLVVANINTPEDFSNLAASQAAPGTTA